jgi:hypothetical protein
MSTSNSQYLSVSSGHIDSLINYVLDVKPYHTKLSSVVEKYFFTDVVNIKIRETDYIRAFLGPDLLPAVATQTSRARLSSSWYKDIIADGSRRVYQVPATSIFKTLADISSDKFFAGTDDNHQIPGLTLGAYSPQSWDTRTLYYALKNGRPQNEFSDYNRSYGAFTFTTSGQTWKQIDAGQAPVQTGALFYNDVARPWGVVTAIVGKTLEEWTLTATSTSSMRVVGSQSQYVGDVTVGSTFTGTNITFTLEHGIQQLTGVVTTLEVGDQLVLTPAALITIGRGVQDETWSIIKTNTGPDGTNLLIIGSLSGKQPSGTIGQWYSNGKIGFKIPLLEAFVDGRSPTIEISTTGQAGSWKNVVSNDQILDTVVFDDLTGVFVATGPDNLVVASLDGKTWSADVFSVVTPGPNQFFIYLGKNGLIATSQLVNGSYQFVKRYSGTTNKLHRAILLTGFLQEPNTDGAIAEALVVGDAGTILTSVTGDNWAPEVSGTVNDLLDASISPSSIVVVGRHGTILRSTDRENWVTIPAPTPNDLTAVVCDGTNFIAVGENGTILRSTDDGLTWLNLAQFNSGHFSDIDFTGSSYIATTTSGTTAISTDGIIWTAYTSSALNSVAYGKGVFVGVGGSGADYKNVSILSSVDQAAAPSEYLITFVDSTHATVCHSIDGYKAGLVLGRNWSDENLSFRVDPLDSIYVPGDTIKIYLTYGLDQFLTGGFDQIPFEDEPFDSDAGIGLIRQPYTYNQEYLPFFNGRDLIIFNSVAVGDVLTFQKQFQDVVRLYIKGADSIPALASTDGWVPLEFRYIDDQFYSTGYALTITAYLGSDPDQQVFRIDQPQDGTPTLLTFDANFAQTYLPFGTLFSLWFKQDATYGQNVRVKFSETLSFANRIRLLFNDNLSTSVADKNFIEERNVTVVPGVTLPNFTELITVQVVEGGNLPLEAEYDLWGYDETLYDFFGPTGILNGYIDIAGVPTFTGNPADIVIPNGTRTSTVETTEEFLPTANTAITEGLVIQELVGGQVDTINIVYHSASVDPLGMVVGQTATNYVVTHDMLGTRSITLTHLDGTSPVTVTSTPVTTAQVPILTGAGVLKFQLPAGYPVPFRMMVV